MSVEDAAEPVLPVDTDRPTWLAARRRGVGGSDTSAVLGVNPHVSIGALWADKTGRGRPVEETEAMRWGHLLEPAIRDEFTVRTGVAVTRTGMWRSRRWDWMHANPDGLCADGGGLEIKTTAADWGTEWRDGRIPAHAEAQAHHYLAVTGLPHWWCAGLVGGQELIIRRVDRDEELVRIIVERTADFWDHVQLGVPPPGSAAREWAGARPAVADKTVEVDPERAGALQAAYRAAKAAAGVDDDEVEAAKQAWRDLIGDAETAIADGQVVATWKQNGAFDRAGFIAAHPELAAEFTREVAVLDVERLALHHPDLYRAHRGRKLLIKGA